MLSVRKQVGLPLVRVLEHTLMEAFVNPKLPKSPVDALTSIFPIQSEFLCSFPVMKGLRRCSSWLLSYTATRCFTAQKKRIKINNHKSTLLFVKQLLFQSSI